MPRIRTVKPEFFTHPEVVPCSIPARLLLISLFTQADDKGRLYDQPRKIGGLAFGETDRVKVEGLLSELSQHGRVCRYDVDGKACLHVLNFNRHQTINKPSNSVIPPCPVHARSGSPPVVLSEPSRGEVEVEQGSGTGNREGSKSKAGEPVENGNGNHPLDALNLGLLESLWTTHPGWDRSISFAYLQALTTGSEERKIPAYGARAVNAAIDALYENSAHVSDPAGYLRKVCDEVGL